jgi:hypothetical protein
MLVRLEQFANRAIAANTKVKQENHSVCPVCLENTNQKKEHLNVKTVEKISSPTSQHNQYANSVMMGNQQSMAALAAFHAHLEKQARRVRRAKLESIAQQKMN